MNARRSENSGRIRRQPWQGGKNTNPSGHDHGTPVGQQARNPTTARADSPARAEKVFWKQGEDER
jgi:hypothetical protein